MTQFSCFPGIVTSVGKVFTTERPWVCHILVVYGHFSSFSCEKQLLYEHNRDPKGCAKDIFKDSVEMHMLCGLMPIHKEFLGLG